MNNKPPPSPKIRMKSTVRSTQYGLTNDKAVHILSKELEKIENEFYRNPIKNFFLAVFKTINFVILLLILSVILLFVSFGFQVSLSWNIETITVLVESILLLLILIIYWTLNIYYFYKKVIYLYN